MKLAVLDDRVIRLFWMKTLAGTLATCGAAKSQPRAGKVICPCPSSSPSHRVGRPTQHATKGERVDLLPRPQRLDPSFVDQRDAVGHRQGHFLVAVHRDKGDARPLLIAADLDLLAQGAVRVGRGSSRNSSLRLPTSPRLSATRSCGPPDIWQKERSIRPDRDRIAPAQSGGNAGLDRPSSARGRRCGHGRAGPARQSASTACFCLTRWDVGWR